MSKLCLTLTETSLEDCLIVIEQNKSYIDLIELRVDFLSKEQQSQLDKYKFDLPTILTFRKVVDGGNYSGSEDYRISKLLEGIKSNNFDFVDLEENLIAPELELYAKKFGVKVIRSFHDFNGVPDNLANRIQNLKRNCNEIPKAAVMINSSADLLKFYREALSIVSEEKILLGMGNYGFNTRILAEKIGSFLTFSSKKGVSAAPGHADPELLNSVYRFREIKNEWSLMGIIGNPVMHTKSPKIHNNGYNELGLDSVYIPFETDNLGDFLQIAELLNIKGFSVTVPFKNNIISYLDSVTEAVSQIGACNTVVRIGDQWVGENTDSTGFITPLIETYGDIKDKNITLIGAGGAAKAALYELKRSGANILVVNRTVENAEKLANNFKASFFKLDKSSSTNIEEYSDIIVQTTNAGMHPLENINPLEFYNFNGEEFLYDIIYTPEQTKFLKSGIEKGCRTLNGWPMLLAQGYRQFKLFTGYEYPESLK